MENNEKIIDKENIKSKEDLFEEKILDASNKIKNVKVEVHKKIVGQDELIDSMIIWLLSKWHILIEWVPWLAKTLIVDTLSKTLDLGFNRLQFTPDLLPSDLIWTEIYNGKTWEFLIKKGPIFNNFILADEINRAPSKVQSALLEAMAEKHITIWKETFYLEDPFIVLATQNPIEQAGTYRLPEAQLDRFMMKVNVDYTSKEDEKKMYKKLNDNFDNINLQKVLNKKEINDIHSILQDIYISDNIFEYVSDLIESTRNPDKYGLSNASKYLNYWVSPRGGLALLSGAKVLALMDARSFVTPEDIKKIAKSVLSHRLVLNYEAIVNDITESNIIDEILNWVNVV